MTVLSIQSQVAYGHVGNSAAVFPLQRLGFEVWPVDTVNFSNHPAYGSYQGGIYHPSDVAEIIGEIERRGAFPRCRAVLSGYLGDPETGPVVIDAVDRVRRANRDALYVLDPVIGDTERGAYVADGIAEFFRETALPYADIVLPNVFELAQLSGLAIEDIEGAGAAAEALLQQGPEMVVVTGMRHDGKVSVLLVTASQAWLATTPFVDVRSFGAGDAFTALFLGHFLREQDAPAALERAMGSIYGVMQATARLGTDALALVEAQRELIAPTGEVRAIPLWAG